LHYRLLRTAFKDFGFTKYKEDSRIICKRATLDEWAKFGTGSKVTKVIRDEQPKKLYNLLQNTLFVEQRKWVYGKFFDGSKMTN